MGDLQDKAKAKADEIENKAHEMKGRAKQKMEDMKKDDQQDNTAM